MTKEVYEKTLAAALADLKTLQAQQAETEKKIVSTKQMIVSLRALLGKKPNSEHGLGLKEACIQVLKVEEGLTISQVAQALEKVGFSLGTYSNPLSAIKNTLGRMVGKELKVTTVKGKKLYGITDDPWSF